MSMWELLIKNEVVDRVDLKTSEYNEAHSYLMSNVARLIANKLNVTTNKYYDE